MRKRTRLFVPEVITVGVLVVCWCFADSQLHVISLACIALLLLRRLEEIQQRDRHKNLILELRSSQDKLLRLSELDRLTGLLNRQAFLSSLQERLERGQDTQRFHCVLFLDFDRFKIVNDSLGHDVGDKLLIKIAERLQDFLDLQSELHADHESLAARLGGDEFVLLVSLKDENDVLTFAETLVSALAKPYLIGESKIISTASIGVVIHTGQYSEAKSMIRDADVAMYESKKAGRGCYLVFDKPMRDRIQRRQRMESGLARAIERSELQLAYQPIVCVATGQLKSVEALMRWQHPHEGLISPSEFIPIAEETGLIQEISDWAVAEGCRQLLAWNSRIKEAPTFSFSLNLSPRQFGDAALAERIQQAIENAGVAPHNIVFELTESVLMSEPESALEILQTIKSYGSRIALDDFGTGHSSLASLHQFPVDVLKFDRSFIRDVHKNRNLASMVHSIALLAKNLGITTVAEGVETPEQFLSVRELGCDLAQGYLIARPLSAEDFVHYAAKNVSDALCCSGANLFLTRWESRIDLGGAASV